MIQIFNSSLCLFLLFTPLPSFFLFFPYWNYFDFFSNNLLVFLSLLMVMMGPLLGSKSVQWAVLFLMSVSMIFLTTKSLIIFFLSFELSLYPIIFLVLVKASTYEKITSVFYLMLFTLFSSMLLMGMLFSFSYMSCSGSLLVPVYTMCLSKGILFLFLFSFLVKLPMFMFHMWLPKAHTESPTIGSMLLAGLLVKLGSFGVIQIYYLFSISIHHLYLFLMMGSVISSTMGYTQSDTKATIAYSSISHMNIMIMALSLFSESMKVFTMVSMYSHGVISSMLFLLVGMMSYKLSSRMFSLMQSSMNKGMMFIIMVLFLMSNMSVPSTIGFYSELVMMSALFSKSSFFFLMISIFIMLMASLVLSLFSNLCMGKKSTFSNNNSKSKDLEVSMITMLFTPILFLI